MVDLKNIFEKRIKKEPKVRSISGVFIAIDETLEHTNYEPAYQRNYVWDAEKATYFIESIFLGTEVPPIILFKSEAEDGFVNYEVIDGRQRYQSIRKFLDNELKLNKNGLQKLGDLEDFVGKSYFDLDCKYQELFKETKIRTIEYSFITDDYTQEEEEAVKREIFQRYNSGITPLKSYEIDKAQYFNNELNRLLKCLLVEDEDLDSIVTKVFRWDKLNVDQKAAKLRELLVLNRIPIKYYASKKQKVISRYFEYISSQLDDSDKEDLISSFRKKVGILLNMESEFSRRGVTYNRLYAECVFWALSVIEQMKPNYEIDSNVIVKLVDYLWVNQDAFTTVRSSFYSVLVRRYDIAAKFFEQELHCDMRLSIDNNDEFRTNNQALPTTEKSVESQSFEELRINKPEPTSVELTELLNDLKSHRFLLRPSYQRADVKNRKKSSSIIESMLLGIMLPPIFVFKRKNGISEVIDGQQRLLSIISFIGEQYKDENGIDQDPLLKNFRLDLGENAILKSLRGSSYVELSKQDQNRIRKTSIYVIEIREDRNPEFDPVDLFVRLNNKPYPIACDSFEMWNSFAPIEITKRIKSSVRNNEKWFYFRKDNARMDNENLYTALAYFQYQYIHFGNIVDDIAPEKTIEYFVVDNRISCRFRVRNEITKWLYNGQLDDVNDCLNQLEFGFVSNIYELLEGPKKNIFALNKSMDELLNADNGKRTQMVFYILWILLHDIPCDVVREYRLEILCEIEEICKYTASCSDINEFRESVLSFRKKYSRDYSSLLCPLGTFAKVVEDNYKGIELLPQSVLVRKEILDNRIVVRPFVGDMFLPTEEYHIAINPKGVDPHYIEAYLRSGLFAYFYNVAGRKMTLEVLTYSLVPFVSSEVQRNVVNVLAYVNHSKDTIRSYFERILDLVFYELYFNGAFLNRDIHILREVQGFPILAGMCDDEIQKNVAGIYQKLTNPTSLMSMYLLKAIDFDFLKSVDNLGRK